MNLLSNPAVGKLCAVALVGLVASPQIIFAAANDVGDTMRFSEFSERMATLDARFEDQRARAARLFARADRFKEGEVIVRYKGEGVPRVRALRPGERVRDAVAELRMDDAVVYAEPNYYVHALHVPNDTYYQPYQWHLDNVSGSGVHAEEAWEIARGAGATVAIVDTGVAYETARHGWTRYAQAPDLAGTCFVSGYDFAYNDPYPNDDQGHGTHVAGTIAQTTGNGEGAAGLAHEACIMPIKALDRYGGGTHADIAAAIRFAADNGADVINLSLGGPDASQTLEDAVRYAYEQGVTIVAAAGNSGIEQPFYPAAYDEYVIAVGATGYDTELASYSNYGAYVDVVAPGGDDEDLNGDGYIDGVLQQTIGRRPTEFTYSFSIGTSMATPHVAAAAALLVAAEVATTPDAVRSALTKTARDLGVPGVDVRYGHGLIDAAAALRVGVVTPDPEPEPEPEPTPQPEEPSEPTDTPPSIAIDAPAEGAEVSGTIALRATANDDQAVTQVSFRVDGTDFEVVDTEAPFEAFWDTTQVADGTYMLGVEVVDTAGQTASTMRALVVENVNELPIADAGDDTTVVAGTGGTALVTLDGYGSTDRDGSIESYRWQDGSGDEVGATRSITLDVSVGTHTYTLMVVDDRGATASDTVLVTVEPMSRVAEVFYDSFEAGEWNGQWQEDDARDWKDSSRKASDGSHSAEVDGRAYGSALTSRAIELGGRAASVNFDWYLDRGVDRGEGLVFSVSTDEGATWSAVRTLEGNVDAEEMWHSETVAVGPVDTLRLRFEGTMSMSNEDAYVDAVRVLAQ